MDRDRRSSTTLGDATVQSALAELTTILAADGARFEVEQVTDRAIRLRLDLSASPCADCVMPATVLAEIIEHKLAESGRPAIEVEIIDPRATGDPISPPAG